MEFESVPPDGAPASGAESTPGIFPLETARRPDVEPGLTEADRWSLDILPAPHATTMALEHISLEGLHLIEGFEGFSAKRYLDSVGVPTLGYGTTAADVFPLPSSCTRAQAEGWLRGKMASKYEPSVRGAGVPLNQHQFDACCSIAYNLGPGIMAGSFTFGRLIRARQYRQAADAMLMYDKAGGVTLLGLSRRRQAERALFLEPMPKPSDPHKLSRFVNTTFTIAGHRINERTAVTRMYQLLEHPAQDRNQIHALMPSIVLLRKRVWTVSHFAHPPSWGQDWRGFRWQALNTLTSTKV
jgi:lysozyme